MHPLMRLLLLFLVLVLPLVASRLVGQAKVAPEPAETATALPASVKP